MQSAKTEPVEEKKKRKKRERIKHETASKEYKCPTEGCAREFQYASSLVRHQRYECGHKPHFKCGYCDKLTLSLYPYLARRHCLKHHRGLEVRVVDVLNDRVVKFNLLKTVDWWYDQNRIEIFSHQFLFSFFFLSLIRFNNCKTLLVM